jgi:HD-like signal output (HDOD) protein
MFSLGDAGIRILKFWENLELLSIHMLCPGSLDTGTFVVARDISTVAETASARVENPAVALVELVNRANSLYTLPTVAMEVLELTSNPKVDVRALKECILRDPAMTAKLLRVVNSSLFGLSRQVSDLNQALALLGINPLKILVLGFSLPENLFQGLSLAQLEWYWSLSLTRAVAAREISEQLLHKPGDEAFLAGLLQDLGILVLVRQLGESYTKLLTQVIEKEYDLKELETTALGFDHAALTAALLDHWNLPLSLVEAVATLPKHGVLEEDTSASQLSHVIYLANLLAELVGQRKLGCLPELLEVGDKLCGLDGVRLREMIATLQPKVEQLAEVWAVDLSHADDYLTVLAAAHERIALLTERAITSVDINQPRSSDLESVLHADVARLQAAMHDYLLAPQRPVRVETPRSHSPQPEQSVPTRAKQPAKQPAKVETSQVFLRRVTWAVGTSRSRRQSLSLAIVEFIPAPIEEKEAFCLKLLESACHCMVRQETELEASGPLQRIVLLPDCDRIEAVRLGHQLTDLVGEAQKKLVSLGTKVQGTVAVGISSVTLPPRNFRPETLVQAAQRCLSAAKLNGTSSVKSLEVY